MINKYSFLQTASTLVTKFSLFLSFDLEPFLDDLSEFDDYYLSYAKIDNDGKISNFKSYYGNFLERKNNNDFIINSSSGYITGYTIVQKLDKVLTTEEKNSFPQKFVENSNLNFNGETVKFGFSFEDIPKDDMYINISVEREIDFLDTLSIKNNLKGEWSKISSSTGVVFGKLFAIQKLKDENGNFIKIPLKNVPIIVLNKVDNISSISLIDDNNARIPLNIKQNSPKELYIDDFSYNFDNKILPSVDTKNVGEKYRYSTLTNDNGEFLIMDVPIGPQTVIFEVDLLKQGLSLEEVELNVAPFPKTNEISILQAPHLIYREIPINVLNSWGDDLNVGYTRLNVDINVDLRKWTTYFVPPITLFQKNYEQLLESGYQPSLNIKVRDMALRDKQKNSIFPNEKIECVVIDDIKRRDFTKLLGWTNEFRQLRDDITFFNLEYNAFKLPSNIYDPNGYKRDGEGNIKKDANEIPNQKGVWLSSYQFRIFTTQENSIYRDTGFVSPALLFVKGDYIPKSYYSLNTNIQTLTGLTQNGKGNFPFEKPWSANYPTPYSIPKKPKIKNEQKSFLNDGRPQSLLVPRYLDGDLVGLSDSEITIKDAKTYGGWGAQINNNNTVFPNKFAQQVTTSELYRYEINGSFGEEYSNGYCPNNDFNGNIGNIPIDQRSIVKDGEQYQRLESGHAYFIWTQGFPRIWNKKTYDEMLPSDFLKTIPSNLSGDNDRKPYYTTYLPINSLLLNDTLVVSNFDDKSFYSGNQKNIVGYSYFYRIIDPDPTKLIPSEPPFISKFVRIKFDDQGSVYIQRGERANVAGMLINTSKSGELQRFYNLETTFPPGLQGNTPKRTSDSLLFTIKNNGTLNVNLSFLPNESVSLPVGETVEFKLKDIFKNNLLLPTNDDFDSNENTYNTINYEFGFKNIIFIRPDGTQTFKIDKITSQQGGGGKSGEYIKPLKGISGGTQNNIPIYSLQTRVNNVYMRGGALKFNPNQANMIIYKGSATVNGAIFISTQNSFVEFYEFVPSPPTDFSPKTIKSQDIPIRNIS
jgi:hypothetical protein